MIKEAFEKVQSIEAQIRQLKEPVVPTSYDTLLLKQLTDTKRKILTQAYESLTPADRVFLARHPSRPNFDAYRKALFTDFFELHGDRGFHDDASICGGICRYRGIPVTLIGTRKGTDLDENMRFNFGMPNPEGYRKALRLMKQAEKFKRPVITLIDTPGAYPGLDAEKHGQGEAIARNLMEMSRLTVPVISVIIGEGGSGGALALSVADKIVMLENAVYSILSPEGFASILWKDSTRANEACELMKLTAGDLFSAGICDKVIREDANFLTGEPDTVFRELDLALEAMLSPLLKLSPAALTAQRYKKYRSIGTID